MAGDLAIHGKAYGLGRRMKVRRANLRCQTPEKHRVGSSFRRLLLYKPLAMGDVRRGQRSLGDLGFSGGRCWNAACAAEPSSEGWRVPRP